MQQDRTDRQDVDRAVLRIRLAGVALGATLLLLSTRSDQVAAGAVLLGYTAAILVQWFARDRLSAWSVALPVIGVAVDVLYAAGISLLLPLTAGTWALYAFAIGMEKHTIVITSGLVELLEDDELRFVIGHELGHIKSGHMLYRTMAVFLSLPC